MVNTYTDKSIPFKGFPSIRCRGDRNWYMCRSTIYSKKLGQIYKVFAKKSGEFDINLESDQGLDSKPEISGQIESRNGFGESRVEFWRTDSSELLRNIRRHHEQYSCERF